MTSSSSNRRTGEFLKRAFKGPSSSSVLCERSRRERQRLSLSDVKRLVLKRRNIGLLNITLCLVSAQAFEGTLQAKDPWRSDYAIGATQEEVDVGCVEHSRARCWNRKKPAVMQEPREGTMLAFTRSLGA